MLSDDARDLIRGSNYAHVATVMPDGSPQVTPVWVHLDGDDILVNSAEGRVKVRNVRRDPRVAVSVIDRQDPYRSLTIRGRVAELTHEGADEHIDELSMKYDGQPFGRTPGQVRVILRIRPEHVSD